MFISTHQDTICALSTAQGVGAIAVIRISGENTFDILDKCFKGSSLSNSQGNSVVYGHLFFEDEIIDEVLISVFKNGRSYTKEDSAEISCHGSTYIQSRILQTLLFFGARLAMPGEFTQRAYLNGRFNLLQAEAVADLIASESSAQHQLALTQMKGGITHQLQAMRADLLDLTSLLELELDFGEEDVEFANRDSLRKSVHAILEQIEKLISSFKYGNAIKKGIPVAIAGPPNVGKSTLLNVLLGEDKAIVSEIPGTTRDVIEDTMVMDGLLFRFIDTAGIRETTDYVEGLGIERSRKMISQAQLVLLLFDHNTPADYLLEIRTYIIGEGKPFILVKNKLDAESSDGTMNKYADEIQISALKELGIDDLKKEILRKSAITATSFDTTISNTRHYEALAKAKSALLKVLEGMDIGLSTELLAEELRDALIQIGSITGEVSPDDILGNIFGKFCIGK